jgi:membrane protease YdiL (CAAX protease family)
MLAGYLLVNVGLSVAAVGVDVARGAYTAEDMRAGRMTLTPLMLLAINLAATALIPLSMLLQWGLFGVRPRWLSSVEGLFRWRLLLRVALFVVPLWLVYVTVFFLLDLPGSTPLNQGTSWSMLAVVLLTTWLQAAGEEYGFRGLVTRSVGSWFASPRTALLVSTLVANLVFMVAHTSTDPWLNVYYFLFGLALSMVVWRTGGLESSVLVHATNNMLMFAVVAIFANGEVNIDRSNGAGGPFMLLPIAMLAVIAVLISWWAARRQVASTGVVN